MGNQRAKAALPSFSEGCSSALQTRGRRVMPMYVTYQDLIQMAIFIVALIGLIYQILKDKDKK